MKVLYIIDTINGSGAERSLVEITSNFENVTPVFVHIYPGEMLKEYLESKEIKVYSLNITKKYGYNEAVKRLVDIYKKEIPDLIHSTLYRSDMIARRLKKKFPEIPLVGSFVNNSYNPLRYTDKSLSLKLKLYFSYLQDRITAKKVDFFISNSETIKKAEGNALNIPQEKIKVIHRGRDPRRFTVVQSSKVKNLKDSLELHGKNVLVNVSRLIERKGQLDIIGIMPDIVKSFPNTVLLIAGHGSFREILEAEISNLGMEQHIKLLGRFGKIPELLKATDIFLYPSYAEGLPGALIEAMMAGKIIINSDIGENMECVGSNSSIVFPVGNTKTLKNKVFQVLNEVDSYRYLETRAKKLALERFDIKMIAKEYERTYSELINNG
ncbi:glycosyltransferase [Christiangramia sp. SM2212]|uniref:Glycosyltransferase n=1 Tax=Christiangramia sediminicola TaxID=3073267 RepID=A0ABU1ERF9_9FLAO|nr:glycosyltransferase [Christiangramia sp. SM2212]MDR5590574.1 glycosyltransferase [Christiangramia sp. SM2212]